MDIDLREDNNINIKTISIDGMNLKKLFNEKFIAELDENFENYTLLNMQLILDGERPSQLVSLGHTLGGSYKNNILTISAESEENLKKILKLI